MSSFKEFCFDGAAVRVVMVDSVPWFIAADIADVLGYRNAPDLVRLLHEDETGTYSPSARAAEVQAVKETLIINASGVYSSISNIPSGYTDSFRRWFNCEVWPALWRSVAGPQVVVAKKRLPTADQRYQKLQRRLHEWLETEGWPQDLTTEQLIQALGLPLDKASQMAIGQCMLALGFKRVRLPAVQPGGVRAWGYRQCEERGFD